MKVKGQITGTFVVPDRPFPSLGIFVKQKQHLHFMEALYLVKTNKLQVETSIQDLYSKVDISKYKVYSHLKSLGYRIHLPSFTASFREFSTNIKFKLDGFGTFAFVQGDSISYISIEKLD
jgi:hypothetical protein